MSPRPIHFLRRGARRGFTLIELLASMSVLTLLMVMVAQMISATAAVTADGSRHLDADSQARLVLDRMAVDFAQIVKRADVDYYFQKNAVGSPAGPDDQMAFYSETSGYYPSGVTSYASKSNTALVGYRIYQRQLQRLDKALVWNGVTTANNARSMTFLPQTLALAWPDMPGNGGDTDYHTIGEQIFRMEFCFLLRNSTTTARFSDVPYINTTTPTPTPIPYNSLRDVAAVVVTLAVLDDTSRLIVSTADLDAAAAKLDDSGNPAGGADPNAATPPAQRWLTHVNNGDLARPAAGGSGLPRFAAARVRVYERSFYLGNAQ